MLLWKSVTEFQFPYRYESLAEHINNMHPGFFSAFKEGWKCLSPALQKPWLISPTKRTNEEWTSWAHYVFTKTRSDKDGRDLSLLSLASKITQHMEHEGILYGLPKETNILGQEERFIDPKNPDIGKLDLKTHIAYEHVKTFQEKAADSLLAMVEEKGVEVLRPLFEGKFDLLFGFIEREQDIYLLGSTEGLT